MSHVRSSTICSILLLVNALTLSARKMSDYTRQAFPPDHALNMPIDSLPIHPNSNNFIAAIGATTALHPDFGTTWSDGTTEYQMGIPYNIVGETQKKVPVIFTLYNDESDPGPWPIPANPYIESVADWRTASDGDRHMLIIDTTTNTLYETGNTTGNSDGTSWQGGGGAVFDLNSYTLRPEKWTSADAAGLPIFPLLIRYDEVERAKDGDGMFHHAIRFTVSRSQRAYLWPARHDASSSTDPNRAPMGLRFRLKASFDITGFSPRIQVIMRSMKRYGLIVADNGSNWYFQGTHDERWSNDELNSLKQLRGENFEAVDITSWILRDGFDYNSAKVPPDPESPVKYDQPLPRQKPSCFSASYCGRNRRITVKLHLEHASSVLIRGFSLHGEDMGIMYRSTHQHGSVSTNYTLPQHIHASLVVLECTTDTGRYRSLLLTPE